MANILIVDDEMYNHQLLKLILIKNKHVVRYANNGQEAIQQFVVQVPDILITDINMPVMDD